MNICTVGCKKSFLLIQVGTLLWDNSLAIQHDNILQTSAQRNIKFGTWYRRCTSSVYHNPHIFYLLACYLKRIQQTRTWNNRCTMLIIMHHRDVEFFLQPLFYLKTLRSLYIFQVNTSECGSNCLYCFNKLIGIFFINFYIEHVNSGIDFKQQSFTFHNWFPAFGTNIA